MLSPEGTLALMKYDQSGKKVRLHDEPLAYRSEDPHERCRARQLLLYVAALSAPFSQVHSVHRPTVGSHTAYPRRA
jgi:hypothetical protein